MGLKEQTVWHGRRRRGDVLSIASVMTPRESVFSIIEERNYQ